MATVPLTQVELGPAWQGPASIGSSYGSGITIGSGQTVAYFPAQNGGGWVAIGSGITSNPSNNVVTAGTFTRIEYYSTLKPVSYFDEVKKKNILSDFDYKSADYCIGIDFAQSTSLSSLLSNLRSGLQSILVGNNYIAGDGYLKPQDFGIFAYGGDDTISPYTAKLASGGEGNDFFDSNPKQRAVLIGGNGNDRYDGSSGADPGDTYYWIGGSGVNRYEMPNKNTVIIIDRKTKAGQADIVLYASALLSESTNTKILINSGSADGGKLAMRWVNADINEIAAVNGQAKLTRLAQRGYVSVSLDGIEQAKISLVDGIDESEYEKERAIIAKKIGIGEAGSIINTQGFSDTLISQIKTELAVDSLAYVGPDLTKTIASMGSSGNVVFAVKSVGQENGVLTIRFNQPVGNAGSLYIIEAKVDGSLAGTSSLTVSDLKTSGDTVTAKLNTYSSGNEKLNYMLWFVSGWTSSQGESLPGQASPLSGGATEAYGFSYQKDVIAPTLLSSEVIDGKLIRLNFSEPIAIGANAQAYVIRTQNPTSLNDLVVSSQALKANGSQLEVALPAAVDGDYYCSFSNIADLAGNYYTNSRPIKLTFADPVVSANRIKLDRAIPDKSVFLLPIKAFNGMGVSAIQRITMNWKADESASGGESFWKYFFENNVANDQRLIDSINCGSFTSEGLHRLNQIEIQFKSGSRILYDSQTAINDFLAKSGLKQGSLDVVVSGKAASAALMINSIVLNTANWDPNDQSKAVYADIAYSYTTTPPELTGSGRLDSISLRYKRVGSTETLYLRGEAMVVRSGQASFQLKPDYVSAIKAGEYELDEVNAYGSPHLYNGVTISKGTDDYAKLKLPKSLTISQDWSRSAIQRQLTSLELSKNLIDLNPKSGQSWGGSGFIIKASETIKIPQQGIDCLTNERITLSFQSKEYQDFQATSPNDRIYSSPTASLKVKAIRPLANGYAAVDLSGYVDIPANCYAGSWRIASLYLSNFANESGNNYTRNADGVFAYNELDTGLLSKLNESRFTVQGSNTGLNWNAVSLEAPITQAPGWTSNFGVDAQAGERKVVLDLVIKDPTLNLRQSDPTYLDYFLGSYLGSGPVATRRPRGVVTLVSPSGSQSKTVVLDDAALSSYGQSIPGIDAAGSELIRFSPTIPFSPNDESGTWRVGRLITWTGAADPRFLISAGTRYQADTKLTSINTLALSQQLGLDPCRFEIGLKSNNAGLVASNKPRPQELRATNIGFSQSLIQLAKGDRTSLDFVMAASSGSPIGNIYSVIAADSPEAPVGLLDIYNTGGGLVGRSNTIREMIRKKDVTETVSKGANGEAIYSYTIKKSIALDSTLQSGQYTIGRLLLSNGYGSQDVILSDSSVTEQFTPIIDISRLVGDLQNGLCVRNPITQANLDFAVHQVALLGSASPTKESLCFRVENSAAVPPLELPDAAELFRFLTPGVAVNGTDQSIDLQVNLKAWQATAMGTGLFATADPLLLLASVSGGGFKPVPLKNGTLSADGKSLVFRIPLDASFNVDTWYAAGLSAFGGSSFGSLDGISLDDGIAQAEAEDLKNWYGPASSFQITSNALYRQPSADRASILRFDFVDSAQFLSANAPSLQSATLSADGLKLQLIYNKSLSSAAPALDYFSVKVDTVERSLRSIGIANSIVTLELASPVLQGQAVVAAYKAPANDPATTNRAIQDLLGNDAPAIATIAVANNSAIALPSVSLAIAQGSVKEDGADNLVYTFTRTAPTSSPLSVSYSVGGSATLGTDYIGISKEGTIKTVLFAANAATAEVTVDPTVDATVEPDETVDLTLVAGTGYTIATAATVSGKILNDDVALPSVSLAISQGSVKEDGPDSLVYTFTRTAPTGSPLSVSYSVGGSATLDTDYIGISKEGTIKTVLFAANAATAVVTVDPTVDATVEPDETVDLTLVAGAGYTIATAATVSGKILNDDVALPAVSLAISKSSVKEDGADNLVYTFTRTAPTGSPLSVSYSVGGSATLGTDYIGISKEGTIKTVLFAANAATAVVTVDPTVDSTVEPDETVDLTLVAGAGYTIATATTVSGKILNDDVALPSVSLAIAQGSVKEDGADNLVYTFMRTAPTSSPLSVSYSVGGSATLGTDYIGISKEGTIKTVLFAANAATAVVTVDPTVDAMVEPDETVDLTLFAGAGYTIATAATVSGKILNDDVALPAVSLVIAQGSVYEDGAPNLIYTFSRTGPTTNPLTVNYSVAGTAKGDDYSGASLGTGKTITFAAGLDKVTLVLDPTADSAVEPDETVALSLVSGSGYTIATPSPVIGTISNDDIASAATATLAPNQSSLTLSGSNAINGTGNALDNLIVGNSGNNLLDGGPGNDRLIGGAGLDTLIGGPGADSFIYTTLGDCLIGGSTTARTFEAIKDVQIGTDLLDGPGSARSLKTLATVSALSDVAIGGILKASNFAAGTAATFLFGSGAGVRTFLALNDTVAGFDPSKDGIIEITGYSGSLAALAVI